MPHIKISLDPETENLKIEIDGLSKAQAKTVYDQFSGPVFGVTSPDPFTGHTLAYTPVEIAKQFLNVLSGYPVNKIALIKAVRKVTDMGLKEAKDFVEENHFPAPTPWDGGTAKSTGGF